MDENPEVNEQSPCRKGGAESSIESVIYHKDERKILLAPTPEDIANGILGFLNPAACNSAFFIRVRREGDDGEDSTIDLMTLENPMKLGKKRKTLFRGEDPRVSYIDCHPNPLFSGKYVITYTDVEANGLNAVPAVALTDLSSVVQLGRIGEIPLAQAIEWVKDPVYATLWKRELKDRKKDKKERNFGGELMLYHKDAALLYNEEVRKWVFITRIEPDIQGIVVDDLAELQDKKLWRHFMRHIGRYTLVRAGIDGADWTSDKIGLGGSVTRFNGGYISLVHGVSNLVYKGSFMKFSINGDRLKATNIIRNPVFEAPPGDENYVFRGEKEDGNEEEKVVDFPSAFVINSGNKVPRLSERCLSCSEGGCSIYVYSGAGDGKIEVYKRSFPWAIREVNHRSNAYDLVAA